MIIKGIAYWASFDQPNTKFDPVYTVDLHITDEEKALVEAEAKKLTDGQKGFKMPGFKKQEDGLWKIKVKQSFYDKDGAERPPIVVVDGAKHPLEASVGNGSVIRVIVNMRAVENKFGKFVTMYLNKVQVVELVEFDREDFDELPGTVGDTATGTDDEEF